MKHAAGFIPLLLASAFAHAGSSSEEYARGRFSDALRAVRGELAVAQVDSSAFLSRVRIATHSFVQDPAIPLRELMAVYDAAAAAAGKWGYSERITEERSAMSEWFARESKVKPEVVLQKLSLVIQQPRSDVRQIRRRSVQLFSIGCLGRRLAISRERDPEWLFVAARALEADSNSGERYFEAYIEVASNRKLLHVAQAKAELERIRREKD